MATKYGTWGWHSGNDGWRSALVYSVSQTDTTYTISATLQIQMVGQYSMVQESISGTLAVGNQSSSQTLSRRDYDENTSTTIITKSRTYAKGASVQSVTVNGTVKDNDTGETSTVSQAFSIPKRSYPVTYDANGGDTSSIPAAQVKYQGETLELSATIPTRPGCTFLGWATAADGTGTAYAAGGSYTANAALKLYAIWLGVSVPTIETQRTDSEGAEADEGTYGTLAASWQVIGSPAANVAVVATNVNTGATIALDGDATGSKTAQQALTGNVSALFGADEGQSGALDTDTRYTIRVTVTATALNAYSGSSVSATATSYITYARITMDFRVGGRGVSFGKTAVRDGFDVAMTPIYLAESPQHDTDLSLSSVASIIAADAGNATVASAAARTWGKVAQLTMTWRNASTLNVGAYGDVTDLTIGTLAEGLRPSIPTVAVSFGENVGPAWYRIDPNGTVTLIAVDGMGTAHTITPNSGFSLNATYILA